MNVASWKKNSIHITPLPPQNGRLSAMVTFLYPQDRGHCGEVGLKGLQTPGSEKCSRLTYQLCLVCLRYCEARTVLVTWKMKLLYAKYQIKFFPSHPHRHTPLSEFSSLSMDSQQNELKLQLQFHFQMTRSTHHTEESCQNATLYNIIKCN